MIILLDDVMNKVSVVRLPCDIVEKLGCRKR